MKTALTLLLCFGTVIAMARMTPAQPPLVGTMPEQRCLDIRAEEELCRRRPRDVPQPHTVARGNDKLRQRPLSLDDAICLSLLHSRVARILAGTGAASSGRTIYDTAISNTDVDQQNARFDPQLTVNNSWNRAENPTVALDPLDPNQALIDGLRTDNYRLGAALTKQNVIGGQWQLGVDSAPTRFRPDVVVLNPENRPSVELRYTQPLLEGFGLAANTAAIELARIDTERSFYDYKNALQDQTQGVIDAYWQLVAARVELWVRHRQLEQADFALKLAEDRREVGEISGGPVAQARVTQASFRATLIGARANAIQAEAALRNIIGLPPVDGEVIFPATYPRKDPYEPVWDELLALSHERRPDVVQFKLLLEADEQIRIQANNAAWPRVDAVGSYRWHGIQGIDPDGDPVSSRPGQFTDWTMGINVSAPLTLRQARAALRRAELAIARDRAQLDQTLHLVVHELATDLRAIDQAFEQYEAFQELRAAARRNLVQQIAEYRAGRIGFINVTQAISDWGNSVVSEANALTRYNSLLSNLERDTGTILESHGILLREEGFCHMGPKAPGRCECYPARTPPSGNQPRYGRESKASEEFFELKAPDPKEFRLDDLDKPFKPSRPLEGLDTEPPEDPRPPEEPGAPE